MAFERSWLRCEEVAKESRRRSSGVDDVISSVFSLKRKGALRSCMLGLAFFIF